MSQQQESMCQHIDAFIDGELDIAARETFERHVATCDECRSYLADCFSLGSALEQFEEARLSNEADLRIRHFLHQEISDSTKDPEILDIEGLTHFLSLPVSEIVKLLDDLPSFEIGGRLRFRRDKIVEWIEERERKMSWEREQSRLQSKPRIIQFPGG